MAVKSLSDDIVREHQPGDKMPHNNKERTRTRKDSFYICEPSKLEDNEVCTELECKLIQWYSKNQPKEEGTEGRYKSDKDIAKEFVNFKITKVEVKPSGKSGYIEILFPNADGEHVEEEVADSWIKYDSGKIAFDQWYPEAVYLKLVNAINEKLKDSTIKEDVDEDEKIAKKYVLDLIKRHGKNEKEKKDE